MRTWATAFMHARRVEFWQMPPWMRLFITGVWLVHAVYLSIPLVLVV